MEVIFTHIIVCSDTFWVMVLSDFVFELLTQHNPVMFVYVYIYARVVHFSRRIHNLSPKTNTNTLIKRN